MAEKFNVLGRFEYNDEHFNVSKENTFELSQEVLDALDGKLTAPTTAGTALQFLQIDANGKPVWGALILKSSTASSTKKFKLKVIDDGTLSAEEIV